MDEIKANLKEIRKPGNIVNVMGFLKRNVPRCLMRIVLRDVARRLDITERTAYKWLSNPPRSTAIYLLFLTILLKTLESKLNEIYSAIQKAKKNLPKELQ